MTSLTESMIDEPIRDVIRSFNGLPCCFTLQSCYGHFVYKGQGDPNNLEALPVTDAIASVKYKIAYVAFCIESSASGRDLLVALKGTTAIDAENIQLCCGEWFWRRQVNSYVLQVEPDRFKRQDTAVLYYREALHIENVRNEFFARLRMLLHEQRVSVLSRK